MLSFWDTTSGAFATNVSGLGHLSHLSAFPPAPLARTKANVSKERSENADVTTSQQGAAS